MTASNNEIYRAIGQLTAEVTSLRRDIQEDAQTAVDTAKRADEHRATIHRRVDELVIRTGKLEGWMPTVDAALTDMKLVTDKVTMWEQRGIGALAFAGIAGTVIGGAIAALVTAYWTDILRVFTGK